MKADYVENETFSISWDIDSELREELFDKIKKENPNCDIEMYGSDELRAYYVIKKRPKKENKVFEATIGVASFVLVVLGMITLLTGMSYGIEFIRLSQLVKILGIALISVGGVGLFCALNVRKWE